MATIRIGRLELAACQNDPTGSKFSSKGADHHVARLVR